MKENICNFCLKKFKVHNYRSATAHFCSYFCYNSHRAEIAYPQKTCPCCQKFFSSNRLTRNNKYCSENCSQLARRKHKREDKNCKYCENIIEYSSHNPHKKFCSISCQIKSRAYKVNENFFDEINSEEKAYILGLVFSDGSISKKRLTFSSTDKRLVEQFRKLLCSNGKIYHYKNSYYLIIGNRHIYSSLLKQGVLERKSWRDYSLPQISEKLRSHFIRGFFDGDGSFWVDRRGNYKYLCASFTCNSKNFLEEIKRLLIKDGVLTQNIRFDKKPNGTGSWQLRISKKESIKKFADYIYKNKNYFLNRKHQIVKNFYGRRV